MKIQPNQKKAFFTQIIRIYGKFLISIFEFHMHESLGKIKNTNHVTISYSRSTLCPIYSTDLQEKKCL